MSKAQEFLLEAATYFEKRPTNGEDKAHWSNVYNAKNCRDIARKYGAMLEALERIVQIDFDGLPMFTPGSMQAIARAALSKAKGEA